MLITCIFARVQCPMNLICKNLRPTGQDGTVMYDVAVLLLGIRCSAICGIPLMFTILVAVVIMMLSPMICNSLEAHSSPNVFNGIRQLVGAKRAPDGCVGSLLHSRLHSVRKKRTASRG